MDPSSIQACIQQIVTALAVLPCLDLSPTERMVLGGNRMREAPLLVSLTAAGLSQDRDLFADIPIDPQTLTEHRARALSFCQLRDALLLYAERAADCCMQEEAQALQGAMAVLRQVRADSERPFGHPRQEERAAALRPAERVLLGRKERHAKRARTRTQRKAPRRS